ncbi:LPD3 domain-containing protein [Capnocytophaga granulosa]|uniref:LPD3 domain-containing protein n=1 Tax=Capnocytophaga granulosa TaxID=45242 RepID=UPI0038575686
MTALEAFNDLNNREVSRQEVEQVLTQAKAENNTAIIYRLSQALNNSPEATHFEITITQYDSAAGLSGVQHTGDYREALDDCGRLRKGWKFVKGNVVKIEEKPKKEAKPKREATPKKEETTEEVSGPKVKDFEAFDYLLTQLLAENADIPKSEVLDFLYNFTDAFEEGKTVFRFWNTPGKKPTEVVLQYKKHPLLTRLQNPTAKMRAYELTPRGYELLEKFYKGVERIKKTYDLGYIAGIHKLSNFLEDRKAYAKKENVQDSSKKEVEKAPTKATKPVKSREENGQNVANFTLLQEPTKVFLEFEEKKSQDYYDKFADKQGAVGTDFLKETLKDLKKQNLLTIPHGFINTEDFPVKPTISKITGIDSLKTIVAKDDLRPALECVLIEANHYVATDANNIILLNRPKNDGLKTGALYDPNYKCTKIGGCSKQEYYRDIERGYPNYKPLLTENPVYTSDWVAIEPIVQHLKSGLEVIRKIYDWKMVYVVKITSNVGEGHYRIKDLLNILQILQSNGAKKIRLYTNNLENKNLNIETDNGNIALTTPVYMGDRSNYADVISQLRIAPIQLHFTQNREEEKGLSGVDNFQGLFGALGLNAPRHEGILKEALTEKGKLKKGWYFQDYGIIDPKGKYHPLEREFAYEYKVASDELNSRAFEQNEKRKRKGFEENIQLQDNLKDFFKSLSQKYKKYFKNYKTVEIFYWAFNFGEKPTKFFTIDETNPYNETQLKVFDKYFSNKNELFTRLENYETFRRYNLTDLGYNIISEIDSFLIKEGKKVRGDIKKINKKYGLNAPFVPEVSTERFKQMKVSELRAFTLRYYNLFLKGHKAVIEKHLKEVSFTTKSGRKIAYGEAMYSAKAAVIAQLKTLIKNSTYNNWGDRKPEDSPNILGYLNFKSKITIDGEKRHLRISVIVDKDRNLELKSYDIGKKKSRDPQGTLPSAEGSQLLKSASTSKATVVYPQGGEVETLSEDKGTKKSLSRKKKDENFGLNAPEAPVTSLLAPRQTLAQQLAKSPEVRESFLVADEQMSLFLGALEKKTKDSLVITLTGKQGSGKTRFAFQFMNALAQRYRVGHASIEEHPESVLYEEKAYQYLNDTALEHITAQDVRSLAELDTMIRTNEVIVIDSFQKMRELAPHFEIDKDLRKKYDGKLFLVIFQQTADGKMRGGSKSQFDGDIILFTETFPDYRENYVYPDKNRYNKQPATELQYSIYEQRMLATAPEVPALPAHYEPTESEELNFEVL